MTEGLADDIRSLSERIASTWLRRTDATVTHHASGGSTIALSPRPSALRSESWIDELPARYRARDLGGERRTRQVPPCAPSRHGRQRIRLGALASSDRKILEWPVAGARPTGARTFDAPGSLWHRYPRCRRGRPHRVGAAGLGHAARTLVRRSGRGPGGQWLVRSVCAGCRRIRRQDSLDSG